MSRKDNPITSRKVTRYYYDGKGYATRKAAYMAKAKAILREMVMGPIEEVKVPETEGLYGMEGGYTIRTFRWAYENLEGLDVAERKRKIDERFGEFFPHWEADEYTPLALRSGCSTENLYWDRALCFRGSDGDFVYKSCKWSQRQWLEAKAKELMEEDDAK